MRGRVFLARLARRAAEVLDPVRIAVPSAPLPSAPLYDPFISLNHRFDALPESRDTQLYPESDQAFLAGVLKEIFPEGHSQLPAEAKCLRILRFVASHIELGPAAGVLEAQDFIRNQEASCAGFSIAFCDLVRSVGLPARYLGIFGLPLAASHAVAEGYYNGKWHLFDPTFGICLFSPEANKFGDSVMSANEVFAGRERPQVMKVLQEPWKKNYSEQASFGIQVLEDAPRFHVNSYWSADKRAVAFPIAYGNSAVVSFPVHLDLRERERIQIGTVDESWQDIYKEYFSNPYVGYMHVGGVCPMSLHTLFIWGQPGSVVELDYHLTPESDAGVELLPLSSLHVQEAGTDGLRHRFVLRMTDASGCALLWCRGVAWVDAIVATISPRRPDGR